MSDTPVKSRFPMTLNALCEMQQSPAYAVRKDVLVCAEEAIVQLERELAEAHRASAEWQQNFETLCRAVVGNTGLSAIGEVRKLKRDAERYRWLKENASDIRWEGCHVVRATMHCLDVSIDAEMKEGK